jgi:outer membrane protein assembly factor BamB
VARLPAAVLGTALAVVAGWAAPEPPAPAPSLPAGPVEVWHAKHGMIGLPAVPVRRLDLASGAMTWSVDVAGAGADVDVTGSPSAAVVAVQATAAASADGTPGATRLSVLDAADGRVLHAAESDGTLFVDATSDLVVAGSPVVGTVAVDRAAGHARWQTPEGVDMLDGRLITETLTGLADAVGLPADAAETDGEISGAVRVLDPATGSPIWEMARPSFSKTSVVGNLLVVTHHRIGEADTVTGYDAATGAQRWQARDVRGIGRPDVAWLGADAVLVRNDGGPATALDRATGALRWTTPAWINCVLSIGGSRSSSPNPNRIPQTR